MKQLRVVRPEAPGPGRREASSTRLRLAMRALDALNRANNPEHPHRGLWHEGDTGKVLALRRRYRRGELTEWPEGLPTSTEPLPVALAPPQLEGAAIVGYCRACGDDLFKPADLCPRCAGLNWTDVAG